MYMEYTIRVYADRIEWLSDSGQLHRIDGPAIECSDGYKEWWVNGQLHRIDGPAVEESDGSKAWYVNGKKIEEYLLSTKIGRLLYL